MTYDYRAVRMGNQVLLLKEKRHVTNPTSVIVDRVDSHVAESLRDELDDVVGLHE